MSLKANGQPEVQKEQQTVGTQGNYIEPIVGEQLTADELVKQYADDFGDDIEDFLGDAGISMAGENVVERPRQSNQKQDHDIITPDGKVLARREPELEDVEDDAYSKEFADDLDKKHQQKTQPQQAQETVSKEQVDLSDYVPKSEHDDIVKKYNTLQGEFNELKKNVNTGLAGATDEELRILRKIKNDYETTPLGLVVTEYYKGNLDLNSVGRFNKAPQDYMPKDEVFDQSDAFTPGTTSYNAREKWEDEKNSMRSKYSEAARYISEISQKEQPDQKVIDAQIEEQDKKLLTELTSKVPVAAKYQEQFINWLQKQQNLYLIAWPVFASQVSNAMKKRGTTQPKEHISGKGGGGYSADDADSQIEEIFGD